MSKRHYLGWEGEKIRAKSRRASELREYRSPDHLLASGDCKAVSEKNPVLVNLNNFRGERLFCDAVIRLADGGVFPVHRVVLAASSHYFRALFTTCLQQPRDVGDVTHCNIANISTRVMSHLLDYSYVRRVDVTPHNVADLLTAADFLGVTDVIELCCDFIARRLAPGNCVGTMRFASNYKDARCVELAHTAYRYVMENFLEVSLSGEGFVQLCVDELRLILGADELNVDNEEYVWDCILKWISHDVSARKQHMRTLLPHVRFGLVEANFFMEQVRGHPWVEGAECKALLIDTMRYVCNLDEPLQSTSAQDMGRPRVAHEVLFAIGGWSGSTPTNQIEAYNCRMEEWVVVGSVDPAGPRAYHGTAVIGFDIYVVGGFDGKERYHSSCRCFNTHTKVWREVAPMHYKRCYISVAVAGGDVYAMGGYDGHFRQNTAERFDASANQWTLIRPMNVQRSDASATSLDGRIYIVGGFNGVECVTSAETYDPAADQWTLIRPMLSRRSGVGCIAYQGRVYALGGFNGTARLSSGEKYDPEKDQWAAVPNMCYPRSNFGVAVVDGMVFVLGGFNGVSTFPDAECLDGATETWYKISYMKLHRSALAACVIAGLPNAGEYIHGEGLRAHVEAQRKSVLDFHPGMT